MGLFEKDPSKETQCPRKGRKVSRFGHLVYGCLRVPVPEQIHGLLSLVTNCGSNVRVWK